MDRVAVVKRLVEVQAVLSDLSCSENEVEAAVSRLREVLYYCVQYDVEGPGRNATFDMKIVKALLGILRSSSSMSLQVKVASCLALLVHENEEGRQRLGRIKNFFQLLVNLISPESSKLTSERELEKSVIPSWSISQADMYEQVLSILRKLTYLNSDNQIRLAQSGGIKLLVNLSMSDIFFRNSGYFCLESKRCLEELTLGKKLPCRAASIQNSSKGAVLSSFQALLGDNCVVTAQYPAFYVNLATDDKKWVSSVMIERGVVWPDHCSLPEEECKWTRVTVTCVEDGNNVWCKFCKEKLDTKMVEMQKSLDKMVNNDPIIYFRLSSYMYIYSNMLRSVHKDSHFLYILYHVYSLLHFLALPKTFLSLLEMFMLLIAIQRSLTPHLLSPPISGAGSDC